MGGTGGKVSEQPGMRVIGVLPFHNNNVTRRRAFLRRSASSIHSRLSQFTIREEGANRAFWTIIIHIGGFKDNVLRGIVSVASPTYFYSVAFPTQRRHRSRIPNKRCRLDLLPAQSHANTAPLYCKHPTPMRAHSRSCLAATVRSLHRLCGHASSPHAPTPDARAG